MKRSVVVVARVERGKESQSLASRHLSGAHSRVNARTNLHPDITPCSPPVTVVVIEIFTRAKNTPSARKNRTSDALLHHFMDGFHVHVFIRPERGVQIAPPLV